ncbi:MAG: DUF4114 domain-containing protein [Actinomycetota bacterium]
MSTNFLANLTAVATAAAAVVSLTAPAQAFSFGVDGISFKENTTIKFDYLESHGGAKSSLGIYEVTGSSVSLAKTLFSEKDAADPGFGSDEKAWLGTAKNLTGAATATYEFLAGKIYTLGLVGDFWGQTLPTIYSTSSLNWSGLQQVVFGSAGSSIEKQRFTGINSFQSGDPFASPVTIAFEDLYGGDYDYNDFVFQAQAVPEPLTMGGLALGIGGMVAARRRRSRNLA